MSDQLKLSLFAAAPSADAQLMEFRQHQIEEICCIFSGHTEDKMSTIKRRETMRAEMKPDVYGGPECDQMVPRWWTYADGDKDGDFEHEPLTLDAKLFPPGTIISIEEPVCPKCEESREPNYRDGKYLPGHVSKCRCGFNWDDWTGNEYS